jgi:hypothetical protein
MPVQRDDDDAAGAAEEERRDKAPGIIGQADAAQPQLWHQQVEQSDQRDIQAEPADDVRVPDGPALDPVAKQNAGVGAGGIGQDINRRHVAVAQEKLCTFEQDAQSRGCRHGRAAVPLPILVEAAQQEADREEQGNVGDHVAGRRGHENMHRARREVERAQCDDGRDEYEVAEQRQRQAGTGVHFQRGIGRDYPH